MKKTLFIAIAIGLVTTAAAFGQARMGNYEMGPGMMTEGQPQGSAAQNQEYLRHLQANMMRNSDGMMGSGYNMMGGYGMMPMTGGGGYGIPPCTAGDGYSMMGQYPMMPMMGGYGMMPMMGGFGTIYGQEPDRSEDYADFVKETREMRKKLHDQMFEYGEARWNPDTTVGVLQKMAEEIYKLRQEIQKKLPQQ